MAMDARPMPASVKTTDQAPPAPALVFLRMLPWTWLPVAATPVIKTLDVTAELKLPSVAVKV